MPDDRLEKARFVRVSKTGDLVFSLGGREMAVSVDDTLERAILEAKQVRSDRLPSRISSPLCRFPRYSR